MTLCHQPKIKPCTGIIARWTEYLAGFDFKVQHIAGKDNVVADAISRTPTHLDDPTKDEEAKDYAIHKSWDWGTSEPKMDKSKRKRTNWCGKISRRQKRRTRREDLWIQSHGVFFMLQRGAGNADLPPSIKTCRHETKCHLVSFMVKLLLLFGERARVNEVVWRLITVEKNPGPRDMTREGISNRMLRKKAKRAEKKERRRIEKYNNLRIATWNVQRCSVGTNNKRKLRSVAKYAEDNNWDAVLLSEVRAERNGVVWLGENANLTAVIHSSKAAVLLRGELLRAWCEGGQILDFKERCVTVKFKDFVLVSVYVPVWEGNNDAEIEIVMDNIKESVVSARWEEKVIVGGDYNSHVGSNEERPGVCGEFGIRESNEQGRKLLEWCENNGLVQVNSFYNHRRRGTWCHPRNGNWYELDGFLMRNNQRHKFVRKVSTVGEVTLSDHKPKLMIFRLESRLRARIRTKRIPRIKFEQLRLPEVAEQYRLKIGELIAENVRDEDAIEDDKTRWDELTELVLQRKWRGETSTSFYHIDKGGFPGALHASI